MSTIPSDNIEKKLDANITSKLISDVIRERIQHQNGRFHANDNISDFINPGELDHLQKEVASKVRDLLKSLVIDIENDIILNIND